MRLFLKSRFNYPSTLEDLGLTELPGKPGVTALMAAWAIMATVQAHR